MSSPPFRIAILGDFSGRPRSSEPDPELHRRKLIHVDRDNLDEVLSRLDVQFRPSADSQSSITVQSMAEFHPDDLFRKTEMFGELLQLRKDLGNPKTFETAAQQLRAWGAKPSRTAPESTEVPPASTEAPTNEEPLSGGLLDQVVEQTVTDGSAAPQAAPQLPPELAEMARRAAEPFRVPQAAADQQQLLAYLDDTISRKMRAVLHHPDFQQLESNWRGVEMLTHELSTGPSLKVFLVDVSFEELTADLASASNIEESGIYRLLVGQSMEAVEADPWSALIGAYCWEGTEASIDIAVRVGSLAAAAGAPFLSAADATLAGCNSFADGADPDDWRNGMTDEAQAAWQVFRQSTNAKYFGLAAPGYLARMPYARHSSNVESFPFDELEHPEQNTGYLWGNPAFACAYLLGEAYEDAEWRMNPAEHRELSGLPFFIYEHDGEKQLRAVIQAPLTERSAERLSEAGIMCLMPYQNDNKARLARWQSVATPALPLAGRWKD